LLLRSKTGGNICNVTSVGGKVSWPWSGCYSASKAAVELFTDSVRREAKVSGLPLRVSTVAPGPVITPLLHAFTEKMANWCDTHKSSPFHSGCAVSADRQVQLKAKGFSADAFSSTSDQVADAVVHALEACVTAPRALTDAVSPQTPTPSALSGHFVHVPATVFAAAALASESGGFAPDRRLAAGASCVAAAGWPPRCLRSKFLFK
jgi:hypothetical protein